MQRLAGPASTEKSETAERNRPFSSWIVVVIIALACMIAMLRIDPRQIEWNRKTRELSKRLTGTHRETSSKSILFLGNSLLQFSLPVSEPRFAAWIESRFRMEGETASVQVLNLTFAGESAESISILADSIFAMHPTAVVVQVDLLFHRNAKDTFHERMAVWAHLLRLPIDRHMPSESSLATAGERLFGKTPAITAGSRSFQLRKTKHEPVEVRLKQRMWKGYNLSPEQSDYQELVKFARTAQEKGIRIIIIETPMSVTARAVASEKFLEIRYRMAQQVLGADSEKFLLFPEVLPDEYFRDYRHVNARGQQRFLQWLVPELTRNLKKES